MTNIFVKDPTTSNLPGYEFRIVSILVISSYCMQPMWRAGMWHSSLISLVYLSKSDFSHFVPFSFKVLPQKGKFTLVQLVSVTQFPKPPCISSTHLIFAGAIDFCQQYSHLCKLMPLNSPLLQLWNDTCAKFFSSICQIDQHFAGLLTLKKLARLLINNFPLKSALNL